MHQDFFLSIEEQRTLLRLARDTLHKWVNDRKKLNNFDSYDLTPQLQEKMGVFVTLNKGKGKQLRGCIGYITGTVPLWEGVVENAINACRDSRFSPVKPNELPSISLEISALTPMQRCESVDNIVVGVHGLVIEKGHSSGLLLPQVASERGWNRTEFLENTCRKAGLPSDSWKDARTVIKTFAAQVFEEELE